MTSIGSPQTRGRASAGDPITCGAFGYGGCAATFPVPQWPPSLTVSPVSDVRDAGEPARYPGTYELVTWRAQGGLARQFLILRLVRAGNGAGAGAALAAGCPGGCLLSAAAGSAARLR